MIALAFIGDGPRDHAIVPHLVARALGCAVAAQSTKSWKDVRLNRGRGFERKLLFVIEEARAHGVSGVVATVDEDSLPGRLAALQNGRARERERHPSFPVALGEARPHGEAWLLDDPAAVREALGLESSVSIPAVHRCASPKVELGSLHARSRSAGERPLAAFARIAELVEPVRCVQQAQSGFGDFVQEVQRELRHLRDTI